MVTKNVRFCPGFFSKIRPLFLLHFFNGAKVEQKRTFLVAFQTQGNPGKKGKFMISKRIVSLGVIMSVYAMHFVGAKASSVVTSKTYVDAKISSSADISSTSTTTAPNEKAVYDAISSATSAANNLLTQVISNADTSHAPSGDAVYDALANKQDTIDTGLVSLGDEWIEDLPAVVSYDTTSGLVGNKYGILDYNGSVDYVDDGWYNYQENSETNHLIPTVGAVGRELQSILDIMPFVLPVLNFNTTTDPAAVDNYSTTFNGTTGHWPSTQETEYIQGDTFAKGLALKQNKIPTDLVDFDGNDVRAIVATNATGTALNGDTVGIVSKDSMGGSWGSVEYWDDPAAPGVNVNNLVPDISVIQEVVGLANTKQNKLGGDSSTAGKVVTATANEGVVTYTTIDSAVTDSSTNLVTSGGVYTAISGKQDTITGYDPNNDEVQSVLTDTTNDGEIGKIELVTLERMENEDLSWDDYLDPETEKIPTVAFVANMMTTEMQFKLRGGGQDTGKVVVAGSNPGVPDYVATYDGSGTYTVATDAGKIATAAAVETKQTKKTCAGWLDGTTVADSTHTDANCVLWNLPD